MQQQDFPHTNSWYKKTFSLLLLTLLFLSSFSFISTAQTPEKKKLKKNHIYIRGSGPFIATANMHYERHLISFSSDNIQIKARAGYGYLRIIREDEGTAGFYSVAGVLGGPSHSIEGSIGIITADFINEFRPDKNQFLYDNQFGYRYMHRSGFVFRVYVSGNGIGTSLGFSFL